MIHLTLQSYYNNEPADPDDDNHPDGLLWPVTEEELSDLPQGTVLEDVLTGDTLLVSPYTNYSNSKFGIRGRREEEMA